ncbi:MAG: 3-keto-5-aminohexanoate cleavage protein [Promethearchaeota archaeon]
MSSENQKVIITAALTGAATRKEQNPAVPYTPEEYADTVAKCYEAGASIVHIHARDPETGMPTPSIDVLRAILEAIKAKTPEILINLSTAIGPGVPARDRIKPVKVFKPELASLNTNSMNFAIGNWATGEVLQEIIFENRFADIKMFARNMKKANTKPEIEVYDMGGLYNILFMQRAKLIPEPLHFQFVFGVLGGVPFSLMNLAHFLEVMPPGSTWSVCGVAKNQIQAAMCAVTQGGHIRVGLEDSIRNHKGDLAEGSWEQVAWAAKVVELAGLEVATPDDTRKILGLRPKE